MPEPPRRRLPFYARILIAIAAGALLGLLAGPRAAPLGEAGRVVITLIKALAAPLLFFAILDAFLRTEIHGRAATRMVAISLTNAAIALALGLLLSNLLRPGEASVALREAAARGAPARAPEALDFRKVVSGLVPSSLAEPFVENTILTIVVIAVLVGAALRRVKAEQIARGQEGYRPVEDSVSVLLRAFEQMLAWVIAIVPLAILGVVAQTVGAHGFAPFAGLGPYVGVALLGLALQVLFVYQSWLLLVARMPLREFWRGARDPVTYALGASSSLATLPVTLKSLDRMGVSPASARLAACVGTNLNNDGILLYEAMAVLFVAQVHGTPLSIGQQAAAALVCLVAGIGIAGVPEAGLISLSLVLATVGLPLEILPLLLTVDWLLSRARAMTNVTSDMVVAVLLDALGRRRNLATAGAARTTAGSATSP
jgi:DAACS family dicarboxylate/amino acid:cation (Na+ or H+) symporter